MFPLDNDNNNNIISVILPSVEEDGSSPFDFILDPQKLIYETNAIKYGGGNAEEDATLLFRRSEGDYSFSKYSDRLSVKNMSTIPVNVTIRANITGIDDINILDNPNFDETESGCMYIALIDDEGHEYPILKNEELTVSVSLSAAPLDTYCFFMNEETGNYEYRINNDFDSNNFDFYAFGLLGYCNSCDNWKNLVTQPRINITWEVEPVVEETNDMDVEDEVSGAGQEEKLENEIDDAETQQNLDEENENEISDSKENTNSVLNEREDESGLIEATSDKNGDDSQVNQEQPASDNSQSESESDSNENETNNSNSGVEQNI